VTASGVDLEVVARSKGLNNLGVLVPNTLFINGQEVLMPSDAQIHISDLTNKDVVTATVTVLVRSLVVRAEVTE
jgi:hypothetical protein